jgi:hypothetical protein
MAPKHLGSLGGSFDYLRQPPNQRLVLNTLRIDAQQRTHETPTLLHSILRIMQLNLTEPSFETNP